MVGILTHEQKQVAFRLRGRGWQLVDIAREIGCSAPMVGLMVRAGRFTNGVPDQWEPRPGCLGVSRRPKECKLRPASPTTVARSTLRLALAAVLDPEVTTTRTACLDVVELLGSLTRGRTVAWDPAGDESFHGGWTSPRRALSQSCTASQRTVGAAAAQPG